MLGLILPPAASVTMTDMQRSRGQGGGGGGIATKATARVKGLNGTANVLKMMHCVVHHDLMD